MQLECYFLSLATNIILNLYVRFSKRLSKDKSRPFSHRRPVLNSWLRFWQLCFSKIVLSSKNIRPAENISGEIAVQKNEIRRNNEFRINRNKKNLSKSRQDIFSVNVGAKIFTISKSMVTSNLLPPVWRNRSSSTKYQPHR